ncbi:MAG: hypothetical protein H0X29_09390, partial [Parachlamydiaceae bacterium]|nr:hypothetical protein [Parachlamydiaceae bacterium]
MNINSSPLSSGLTSSKYTIENNIAQKSFDKTGKVINEGGKQLRLNLKVDGVAKERFRVAIKETTVDPDGKVKTSRMDKIKYIPLKLSEGSAVLVNISSLASRLHLTEKEIRNEYMNKASGSLNLAKISERAEKLNEVFTKYDAIMMHHSTSEKTAVKISQSDFEKIVSIAVTQDLKIGKKIKVGSLFKRVKVVVTKDSYDRLLILTKVSVLGKGAFAKVRELKNISFNSSEALVSKTAMASDVNSAQVNNESNKLNYLWSNNNGKVPIGIQAPPIAVFQYLKEGEETTGFITRKHDGDLPAILKNKNIKLDSNAQKDGAIQLLEGLVFMQSKELLHGDIKPDNIGCKLQEENGKQKIHFFFADFGGARIMGGRDNEMDIFKKKSLGLGVGGVYT